MAEDETNCPGCSADLRGNRIPGAERHLYTIGATHFSRKIGVVVRGIFDGVLYWQCPDCGHRWHRFPVGDYRRAAAEPYVYVGRWSDWGNIQR